MTIYIQNLMDQDEGFKSFLRQFEGKRFDINLIDSDTRGTNKIKFWNSIKYSLNSQIKRTEDFIIICEPSHQFTSEYSYGLLIDSIMQAKEMNADILVGGVSAFSNAMQVSKKLFWVEKFEGLQFTVIFEKFFEKFLHCEFRKGDVVDYRLCSITDNKYFIYPFISIEKDTFYVDSAVRNNVKNRKKNIFKQCRRKINTIKKVAAFYQKKNIKTPPEVETRSCRNMTIPTYIINLPKRKERRDHIEAQFKGRNEFDIKFVKACRHEIGAVGLWLSIRNVIETAIEKDEDVIIICEDDHEFTDCYSKEFLIYNILEAHKQYADYILGGIGGFDMAVPITESLFWLNQSICTQFIVIYKKFFKKILNEPFNNNVVSDLLLSEMTANKMVLYPFISKQKDFGYSDVTPIHNAIRGLVDSTFIESSRRLKIIQRVFIENKKLH